MEIDFENYDDITKFFYVMYENLIAHKNQNNFAGNLNTLLKVHSFGDFKTIKDIKILILNLKSEYKFAYKLCLLSYIKCDLFHKIANIYSLDLKLKEGKILELVVKKLNEIHNNIEYINAFDKYSYKTTMGSEVLSNTNMNMWEFETRREIINSLILIVERFGIEDLKTMSVKIITYGDTLTMSFKELSKYYNKQIMHIKKSLKMRKQYCDSFIEIEKSFVMALITFDETIEFDDFDIVIESKLLNQNTEIDEYDNHSQISADLDSLEMLLNENLLLEEK